MPFVFKQCTTEDLDTLLDISKVTFIDTYVAHNNPEDFQSYMEKAFARERITEELRSDTSLYYLACADQKPVGYFKLNREGAQTDINDAGSVELERIYLLKSHQDKQLGNALIQKAIEVSRELKASYLWLGVWDQNARAIAFYEKNGFVKFGQHPFMMGDDEQTDWLMKMEL
ncbi:GNAT family N-acetyltransferase [Sinomicrobium kalidii]|uniref:GNAT family N-acetyltransferase n=1 Tax=Sinomicrobium kalidii TaxID=2900738 RepID=UPI001E3AF419|nr:GNAT family N-acetyltransferase [Sinomicrobium kalidii]UGU14862.1 GNAT family N-acetyltransferase [Sinomicrobium kalidii]